MGINAMRRFNHFKYSFLRHTTVVVTALICLIFSNKASADETLKTSTHFITQINMALEDIDTKKTKTSPVKIPSKPRSNTPLIAADISSPLLGVKAEKEKETKEKNTVPYEAFRLFEETDYTSIGHDQEYQAGEDDTLLDIARSFKLGYVEIRAANPHIDPWTPSPGQTIKIPTFHLLPRAIQEGIVVNLGDMRLYKFSKDKAPESFPIGIGREGLNTPLGKTSIVRKKDGPSWYPTERMRKEKPELPRMVAAGPQNPLGTHALYLGWPTFLIHGTNKPWGIGRRVSSGCIRLYPENIIDLFDQTPKGTPVTIVDQAVKLAWVNDKLYLEVHPSKNQANDIESSGKIALTETQVPEDLKIWIKQIAGDHRNLIDWDTVEKTYFNRMSYPVIIAQK